MFHLLFVIRLVGCPEVGLGGSVNQRASFSDETSSNCLSFGTAVFHGNKHGHCFKQMRREGAHRLSQATCHFREIGGAEKGMPVLVSRRERYGIIRT